MNYKGISSVDRKVLLQPHPAFGCLTLDMGEDEDIEELRDKILACLKCPKEQNWNALNDLFQQGLLKYVTIEQFYSIMRCLISYLKEQPQRTMTTFRIIYECVRKFKPYLTPDIVDFLLTDSLQLLTKTSKLSVTNNTFSTLYLIIQMLSEEQRNLFFSISLEFYKNSTALDSFPHSTFMLCFHEFFNSTSNVLEYFKIFFPVLQTFFHIKQWTVPKDCLELLKIVFTREPISSQLFLQNQNQSQHNNIHFNDNQHNDIQINNIQLYDIQLNNIPENDVSYSNLENFLMNFLKPNLDTLSADAIDLYTLFIENLNYVPNINFLIVIFHHFLPTENILLELSVLRCFTSAIRISDDAVRFFIENDIFPLVTNYAEMNFTQRTSLLAFAYEALNKTRAFLPAIKMNCTELVLDALESADAAATLIALRMVLAIVAHSQTDPFDALDLSTAAEIEDGEIREMIDQINRTISEKQLIVY